MIVLSVNSAPGLHRRNKRSLGLLAAGYNTLVGDGADGFLGGVLGGVASPFNDLTTLQKIGVTNENGYTIEECYEVNYV